MASQRLHTRRCRLWCLHAASTTADPSLPGNGARLLFLLENLVSCFRRPRRNGRARLAGGRWRGTKGVWPRCLYHDARAPRSGRLGPLVAMFDGVPRGSGSVTGGHCLYQPGRAAKCVLTRRALKY